MMPSVYELEWRAREREREIQEGLRVARLLEGVERRSLWSRFSRLRPARPGRPASTPAAKPGVAREAQVARGLQA